MSRSFAFIAKSKQGSAGKFGFPPRIGERLPNCVNLFGTDFLPHDLLSAMTRGFFFWQILFCQRCDYD